LLIDAIVAAPAMATIQQSRITIHKRFNDQRSPNRQLTRGTL
jgi:hypothetical protein